MITEIIMPKMSNTMVEGRIMKWFKKEDDHVEKDEVILEILTDKVNMEVDSLESGYLRKILYNESEDYIKIGEVIGLITDEKDEKIPNRYLNKDKELSGDKIEVSKSKIVKISPRARKLAKDLDIDISLIIAKGEKIKEKDVRDYYESNKSKKSTPLADKIASKNNVDLNNLTGTGIKGKITKSDVKGYIISNQQLDNNNECESVQIAGIRKIVADRMSNSKFTAPHVYFFKEINMEKCIKFRNALKKKSDCDINIGFTSIITFAVIKALNKYPQLNACVSDDVIKMYKDTNIGIAVDVQRGLIVPVIMNANRFGLKKLSEKVNSTIKDAKDNLLLPEQLNGGTFTISNLGPMDSDSFTAIINAPQVAILAVSSTKKKPVVIDDEICIKPIMNITLTVDHRIIDGSLATRFLNEIKDYLENPEYFSL